MLAGWHCAWLPCCMPGPGYTLVPMPSHLILLWLAPPAGSRDLPTKQCGGGVGGVGFVYSDFKSGNTPGILFIVPLKLVLYLVNYTSIKIGWKSSSWSNKSLRIINMQIPQCPAWPPSYEIRCILVFILQIAIIATSKRKGNFFYTKFQTQLLFNKKLYWRINSTSWMMSVFSVWITSY